MNPIIKAQLENCRVANVPKFDDTTTSIKISKGSTLQVTPYQVNKCYLVELADYIIDPPDDFTLADNWNKGSIPQHKYYKCEISQIMGKMIRITGCGYDYINHCDTTDVWEGWVPQQGIKLIEELK